MSKRREELGITLDVLEERTKIKKQHLSVLERAAPHSLTGKAVTPKRPTVEKIARGLESPIEDALEAAGYVSQNNSNIETLDLDENVRVQLLNAKNYSEEDKREFLRDFQTAYEIAKRRIEEKKKHNE